MKSLLSDRQASGPSVSSFTRTSGALIFFVSASRGFFRALIVAEECAERY